MKMIHKWVRPPEPPEPDEDYVESVRSSLAGQKAQGIRSVLMAMGCFALFFALWYVLEWEFAGQTDSPGLYYYRASGVYFGMAGGALAAFCFFSFREYARRRVLLDLCLTCGMLIITVLMIFWIPSLVEYKIQGISEQAGFMSGAVTGLLPSFVLYVALHGALCARQRFFGERRTEQMLVRYHDQLMDRTKEKRGE